MKNRVMYSVFFVLIILVGVLIWFFVWSEDSGQPAAIHPPLRIAVNVWPGTAHAFIAQEKGFFKKNGVQVHLILNTELSQSVTQYREGRVDGLVDAFSNTIMQVADGLPTKVVYISDYSNSGDVIVGRSEFASLANLKGRKVSFEQVNTFSHIYVLKALEEHGLDESNVSFDIVPPSEVLMALESGQIDAGHTWEPTTSRALAAGYKILSQAGDIPGIITDVLSFSAQTIMQRPQDIQAVVQSMVEAHAFVVAHQEEAVAIMAKAEGMSQEEMLSGLGGVIHLDVTENIKAMTPSKKMDSLHGSGGFIIQYLLRRGQLRNVPVLADMMDPRFVTALQDKE